MNSRIFSTMGAIRAFSPTRIGTLLVVVVSLSSLAAHAGSCNVTTPGAAVCVIPAGVVSVNVVATGGGGGSGGNGGSFSGGNGGVVTQTLSGVGGTTLSLFVGGGGGVGGIDGGWFGGGGGGGSSNVNAGTASQIIAGGGGGGMALGRGGNGNGETGQGWPYNGGLDGTGGSGGIGGGRSGMAAGVNTGGGGSSGVGGAGGAGGNNIISTVPLGGGGGAGVGVGGGIGGGGGSIQNSSNRPGGGGGGGGGFGGGGGGVFGGGGGGGSTGGVITVASNGGQLDVGGDGSIVITWPDSQAALIANSTTTTPTFGSTATLSTTGGSGTGAVTYSSNNGNCTISGTTLTAAAVGSCTITATKAADANYTPATATLTITVGQASQSITFGAAPTVVVGSSGMLSSTGGASGIARVYASSTLAACTVNGSTGLVTGLTVGSNNCSITANQAGNTNYSAAPQASQSFSIGAAPVVPPTPEPPPTIPPLGVSLGGVNGLPSIVNMAAGVGPAFMDELARMLSNTVGQALQFEAQNAQGTVTLSGFKGGKLAFVPHSFQSGDARANGVYAVGNGQYQVVRNGQSLTIAPATARLDQLTALFPGLSVTQGDNGVLIASLDGVTYVVQPGVAVQLDPATGNPQLIMGGDGYWHFIDALGNNQILYPAFADPIALRNVLQSADPAATLAIQLDGTASVVFNGQHYTLVPDLTLAPVPAERVGQYGWQESATRAWVVNAQPLGTVQGFTVRP